MSINLFLQERIDAADFPSAVYLVAEKGEIVLHESLGFAVVEPERIEARADTIYDLASITKVLVTGLLAAMLVKSDKLDLSDRVADLLPEFDAEDKGWITVQHLLTHTSRLPAWRPLYLEADRPERIVEAITAMRLEDEEKVTYSDLGFILLGKIIERIEGRALDEVFAKRVAGPLGLKDTMFRPDASLRPRIAASELGNEYERQICIDRGYLKPRPGELSTPHSAFRTHQIWGDVHDGNAFFMNGVAGHAGLFGAALEVFEVTKQFLPGHTRLLTPETCGLFATNLTPELNEHRSFAFQLGSTPDSVAGPGLSPRSFGHLGFTGTSLWVDPVKDRVFILLTNRTHNRRPPFVLLNEVRRRFHDKAVGYLSRTV